MPADIGPMIFGYVALAAVFGGASGALLSWDAPGSLAKQFLIGALWPISVPIAALCALFLGTRAIVRSFGELLPRRDEQIPRARAEFHHAPVAGGEVCEGCGCRVIQTDSTGRCNECRAARGLPRLRYTETP